jgi:hypothetical protein
MLLACRNESNKTRREMDGEKQFFFQTKLTPMIRKKMRQIQQNKQKTPWSESASELYRPSDRRMSEK